MSITECGASGAIQEISLAVVSGIAGGLATYVVGLLKDWKGTKGTLVPESEEGLIKQFARTIRLSYQPNGELTVLEQKTDGHAFTAVIRDLSGVKFFYSVDRETGFIRITRGERT